MNITIKQSRQTIQYIGVADPTHIPSEFFQVLVDSPVFEKLAIEISAGPDSELWVFDAKEPPHFLPEDTSDATATYLSNTLHPFLLVPALRQDLSVWTYPSLETYDSMGFENQEQLRCITGAWSSTSSGKKNRARVLGLLTRAIEDTNSIRHCLGLFLAKLSQDVITWLDTPHYRCALNCLHASNTRVITSFETVKKDIDAAINGFNLLAQVEIEILVYVSQGLTNLEISQKLNLSESKVRNSISSIYELICAKNRAHASSLTTSWISRLEKPHRAHDESSSN